MSNMEVSNMEVKIVVAAMDRFTAPAKKITQASDRMTAKMQKLQVATDTLSRNQHAVDAFISLKKSVLSTSAALDEAQAKTNALAKKTNGSSKALSGLKDNLTAANTAVHDVQGSVTSLSDKLKVSKESTKALSLSFGQAARKSAALKKEYQKQTAAIATSESKVAALAKKYDASSKAVLGFKKNLTEARSAVRDATESMLTYPQFSSQRMGKYMKELGGHTPAVQRISKEWKAYKESNPNTSRSTTLKKADTSYNRAVRENKQLAAQLNKTELAAETLKRKLSQQIKVMDTAQGETNKLAIAMGISRKATAKLENGLAATSAELKLAKERTAALKAEVKASDAPNKELIRDFRLAKEQSAALSQSHKQQQQQLQSLRSELRNAGINTRNLSSDQKKLKQSLSDATAAMEREKTRLDQLAASQKKADAMFQRAANISFAADAVGRTGDAITGALSKPLNKAIEFETAMAGVAKTTNFTPDGLNRFGDKIKDISKHIPIAVTGLLAIAATGGQLGIANNNLDKFTVSIAKMSVAFDMAPDQVAESMAKMANVYGIPIQSIDMLADKINELSNNSPSKAREIIDVMRRIGSTAKQFNLVSDQAAALSSTMISLGNTPETAATAINSMLQKIQTADQQGKKFTETLSSIGISATDLAEAVQKDAQGALTGLLQQLSELDAKQRTGVLVNLFGTDFADNVGTLVNSLGEYKKQLVLASNDAANAGSNEREFQKQAGTSAAKIQLMQSRWDALQINIGNNMIPILERLMPVIESVIDGLDRFVTNNRTLVTVIIAVTAGIGGIALVVAPVLTAVAALISSIAALGWASRKASIEVAARGGRDKIMQNGRKRLDAVSMLGKAGLVGSLFAMIPVAYEISKSIPLGAMVYDLTHDNPLNNQKPIVHKKPELQQDFQQAKPIVGGSTTTTTNNSNYHITLNANGNQNGAQMVDDIEQEIKRRDDARGRGMMGNRESDL